MLCEGFYFTLFRKLVSYIDIDHVIKLRKIILQKLLYGIMPFRVWNQMWLRVYISAWKKCVWSIQKCISVIRKYQSWLKKKLVIKLIDYFPVQLSYSVITDGCVNLFVHSAVMNRQKLHEANFGTFFYEVINSPFLLRKFHIETIARIVFNHCDKYIFPVLLSYLDNEFIDCRKFTVCTKFTCLNIKKFKVKEIVSEAAVKFQKNWPKNIVFVLIHILLLMFLIITS